MIINGIMLIFFVLLSTVACLGMFDPRFIMRNFETVARVLNWREERVGPSLLLVLRCLYGFFFILGLIMILGIVQNKITF